MTAIDLSPRLLEQVQSMARWQHVTADELAMRALSSYLDRLELEKLQSELDAFQAQLPVLLATYPDQYVAMHEGHVIDHDVDLRTLHSRVYTKVGLVPVLLQKATEAPAPDILIRSPRLEA
jgi:ferric iron reductase protein FhuF